MMNLGSLRVKHVRKESHVLMQTIPLMLVASGDKKLLQRSEEVANDLMSHVKRLIQSPLQEYQHKLKAKN